jgi:hypothetical protein
MSGRSGVICAQRGSELNTSAAACAADVTLRGAAVAGGVPVVLGAGVVADPGLADGSAVPGAAVEPGPPIHATTIVAAATTNTAVNLFVITFMRSRT